MLADSSADVHTTGTTAFYRPAGTGSFDVTASSTDGQSGILDYSFPVLAGFTGSGAGATRTYTLATPTEPNGAKPVTARNQALLSSAATNFTLTSDATGPTGGALTVNSVAASGGGTQSYDGDGAFTIGARTDYNADAASGFATSTLTREQGTLNADACSAYGAPTTLVGTPAQSGLATGCYRYVLTGTDNVGNTSTVTTVVKVDTTAPAAPGLVLADSSADVHTTGTTAFYRPAGSGSFDVTATATDAQSGILDYVFPDLVGFDETSVSSTVTYTLNSPTEPNGNKTVTARNQALLTTGSNFTLTSDAAAPTGGALTVNTVAASAAARRATTTTAPSRSVLRTDYTDAISGIATSTLTREQGTLNADACSAYGAPTTLVGTPAQSGLATGCYRYVLTGTDNVGNTVDRSPRSSRSTPARRPPRAWCSPTPAPTCTPPAPPPSTGPPAAAPSTSPPPRPTRQSGILDYSFPVLAGFTGSGAGATRTYTLATPTEPNGAKPVTARNQALLSSAATNFTLTSDSAVPVSGALTVNTVAASGGGTQSYDGDGAFTIGTPHRLHRRDLGSRSIDADARAGHCSTRTPARPTAPRPRSSAPRPRAASPPAATATSSPAPTTSATPSSITTIVKVDTSAPAAPGLVLTDSSADVHTTGTTAFYRPAGTGSFDVTASSTDAESGVLDYSFPVLAGFTGSGAGATRTYTLATPTEPNGAKPVTARNQALLSSTATNFTLTADSAVPVSGALTVNTVAARGGGTQSYDSDGTFTIGVRTDYTDAASGLASSTLTREQGTLNADACSAYGAPTTLVGTPAQSGLATGCYRYVLTGTDNVGNTVSITTIVKVDTTRAGRPGPGARRLQRRRPHHRHHRLLPARRHRLLRRHRLARPTAQSGILDYSFPVLAGFTGSGAGATRTYTLATPTEPNGAKPVTARNQALLSSTATNFTLTSDAAAPTGGALTVNTVAASRRRHAELRQRRHLHDRSPHRLHRCDLGSRYLDADA